MCAGAVNTVNDLLLHIIPLLSRGDAGVAHTRLPRLDYDAVSVHVVVCWDTRDLPIRGGVECFAIFQDVKAASTHGFHTGRPDSNGVWTVWDSEDVDIAIVGTGFSLFDQILSGRGKIKYESTHPHDMRNLLESGLSRFGRAPHRRVDDSLGFSVKWFARDCFTTVSCGEVAFFHLTRWTLLTNDGGRWLFFDRI